MKTSPVPDRLPAWLQWSLAGVLGLILVLMPLHAFISTWGGTAIGPLEAWKSWKEVLLVLVSVPLLGWLVIRPQRLKVLLCDSLSWWLLAYVAIVVIMALVHFEANGRDATLAGLAMNGRYVLAFALSFVLFRFGSWHWPVVQRYAGRFILGVGAVLALVGLLQITLLPHDFLAQFGYDKKKTIAPAIYIDENPDAPRAFATLRGPNDYGAFLILPLVLSLLAARRWPWMLAFSGLLLSALYVSGSRSAWVGAVVAVIALLWFVFGKRLLRDKKFIIGALAALAIGAGAIVGALSVSSIRLAVFHSSPGDASLTEGSTDAHWAATSGGITRVVDNPLGCGIGCAGPASYYGSDPRISENYYVQLAEEIGVLGLIAWLGLVGTVAWRLWQRRDDWLAAALLATLVGLSVIGLWLHVWSDDPLSLTWWLLAGATLGHYGQILYSKR